MIKENELIPFVASSVPDGPWLIYAPHPDDETFGMGGAIILARQQNIAVTIVVVTDGALGGSGGSELSATRRKEVECVAERLGISEVVFLNQPDRQLQVSAELVSLVAAQIREINPASLFFPSPLELHPDHRQTAQLVWSALQAAEFTGTAVSYEITARGRVNLFVDITDVAAEKMRLMEIYQSQLQENDYPRIIEALCQSRTYTLPPKVIQAEGFWAYPQDLQAKDLCANIMEGLQPFWRNIVNLPQPLPLVSVIIRTKDRPGLLREAIQSVAGQTYPSIELVVINDGGSEIGDLVNSYGGLFSKIRYSSHPLCRGRSAAANTGLANATGDYLIFLDDDDLFDPEHISGLVELAVSHNHKVVYAGTRCDGDSGVEGVFNWQFDPIAMKANNYLPIHSVLFAGELIDSGCRFDEGLEVYEDWDFWLQVAGHTDFVRLDKVTATYRKLGDSQVGLSSRPEKISESRAALFAKWRLLWSGRDLDEIFKNLAGARSADVKCLEKENRHLCRQTEELKRIIIEKDSMVSVQETAFDRQTEELEALAGELSAKERTMSEMLLSRSWRLTTPLRQLNLLAKNIVQKINRLKTGANFYPLFCSQIRQHGVAAGLKKTMLFLCSPSYRRAKIKLLHQAGAASPYRYVEKFSEEVCLNEIESFAQKPLISIVVPVYNVAAEWLAAAVSSVERQLYSNWQLILVDDGSTKRETIDFLQSLHSDNIKIIFNSKNVGIATTTNKGIEAASGEYIGLLDNDDELTGDALFEVVKSINNDNAEIIYSDEDFIDEGGLFSDPHFKPDYSPDLLLSHNYITHFLVFKKSFFDGQCRFSSEFDGAQDYDFLLRITERTRRIQHVAKVLYHWRKLASSTSCDPTVKPEAMENGRKAVCRALRRRKISGHVYHGNLAHYFRVKRQIIGEPLVSVIIPFKDKVGFLRQCIDSIYEKSTYNNFEVIGINNNSVEEETLQFMSEYEARYDTLTFYNFPNPFNFSEINNFGVGKAQGCHVVLLNNDIQVITPAWLEAMLEHSQRQEVGAVGAKLVFGNETIQHAGIVMGIGCNTGSDEAGPGIAGHSHKGFPRAAYGYFNRLNVTQNFCGVTGACLMVKKAIYEELGGLDGVNFAVSLNDVDFCLRLHLHGYLNVFTPYAELYHHESISRGYECSPEQKKRFAGEQDNFHRLYGDFLKKGDPFYNPNLTLLREDFSVGE